MSTEEPENGGSEKKHRSESLQALNAKTLKTLIQDSEIEGYILSPHFLAKIFAIAEQNPEVEKFLSRAGFYEQRRPQRLQIIQQKAFFDLLTDSEKDQLFEKYVESLSALGSILDKQSLFSAQDLNLIIECARRCRSLQDIIDKNVNDFRDIEFDGSKTIACLNELKRAYNEISEADDEFTICSNYVKSDFVESESARGTCVEIVRNDVEGYRQTSEEERSQGRWKLHVSINMEKNSQETIDAAYDLFLQVAKKNNIFQLKILMPFRNMQSMEGRELTVYLQRQDPADKERVLQFIREVEVGFKKIGVIPREHTIAANKRISEYFEIRNSMGAHGEYLSAENAEIQAFTQGTEPYNPFGYADTFGLGSADLSRSAFNAAKERELADKLKTIDKESAKKDADSKVVSDKTLAYGLEQQQGKKETSVPSSEQPAPKDKPKI